MDRRPSSVIAVVAILLAILFVTASAYFYYGASEYESMYQAAEAQLKLDQNTDLLVWAQVNSTGYFFIGINNTGTETTTIVALFVTNPPTSQIIQYDNATSGMLSPSLPYPLSEPGHIMFATGMKYQQGESLLVKVLSSSGRVFSAFYFEQ